MFICYLITNLLVNWIIISLLYNENVKLVEIVEIMSIPKTQMYSWYKHLHESTAGIENLVQYGLTRMPIIDGLTQGHRFTLDN